MKTIDTLVQDIKDLIDGNHTVSEEAVEQFGHVLAEVISRRLFEKRTGSTLRMSNIGTPCERKLWYEVSDDHDGEVLPVEAKIKFLFGDILEELLLFLAKESGHDVQHRQKTVTISGVDGHIDAVIDGELVDVKSASSFSFTKFERGGLVGNDPFGYIPQLNAYHYASKQEGLTNSPRFAFLVIDKQLGKITLDVHKSDGQDYDAIVSHKRSVVSSSVPPRRGYMDEPDGKSGNRKLPTVCGYCAYKQHCWPGLRTFIYASGPRYLTSVERLPDVPEVASEAVDIE